MNAHFVSIYEKPPPSRTRHSWWRFVERQLPMLVIYLLVATLVGVVLAPFTLVTVPSGYVGVLWKRFGGGTVLDPRKLKDEGMRFLLPWNQVFLYDLRLQSVTETYNAISRDGISLTASINIRYRLKREAVPQLHQSIGPNYVQALIGPEIGNRMREVIAEYTAEDVYSTKRGEIQTKIRERAETMLGEKMMVGSEGGDSEDLDNAPYRIPLYAMINLINTMAWPYGTLQIAGAAQMPLYYPRSRLFSLRLNAPTAAASAACGSGASRRDSRRLMRRREACPII